MVYAGIVASTLIVSLGAFVVSRSLGSMRYTIAPFDALPLLAGLGALMFAFRQRQRLGDHRRGQTAEEWWGENAGPALLLWGLLELGALIGSVLLFATGRLPVYAVLAALALAGLVLAAPGRLARE